MLYVFHVDTGRMIKFDMNVALSSVQNLKEMIERLHGLPAANIVLLVSGGEMLTPGSLVCSYSAGTDTNPIYMFTTVDVNPQPWPSIEPDVDLKDQVDRSLALPPTYSTVVSRAQLAQQIYDLAREEEAICERLVHEQHLQQQGWSAVIANMEDLTEEFRQRFENFHKFFGDHLQKRQEYFSLLEQFNDDLDKLSRIPILPGLMQTAEEFHGFFDEYLNNDEVFSRSNQSASVIFTATTQAITTGTKTTTTTTTNATSIATTSTLSDLEKQQKAQKISQTGSSSSSTTTTTVALIEGHQAQKSFDGTGSGGDSGIVARISNSGDKATINSDSNSKGRMLTLLQWISAKENHNTLKIMAEECKQGLSIFDKNKFENMKKQVLSIISIAENDEIKEIKGLEDRLCGLEKLMFELRKLVQEQKELSTAFQQNQNRASNLGDASILPDLCASHRSQLLVMLQSQKVIRDIRRRISRAKDELGANLEKRLKYIINIENNMSELDNTMLFYHRCIRRVERHLNIIQQIHQTPSIYVAAVTEVVRRRIFSNEFINWASNLACDFYTIHNEEISRRQEFNAIFEGHYLNKLFSGMNDMPPVFASETPIIFDSGLPNITKKDLDILSSYLPEISSKIQFPDMGAVIDFFISRSGTRNIENETSVGSKMQMATAKAPRPIDMYAHLKDGFESETDTEEFENVGQIEPQMSAVKTITVTATVSTSTTENIPQMTNASTSMEDVKMHSVETLTENHQLPQTYAPKKPPRLSKIVNNTNANLKNVIKQEEFFSKQSLTSPQIIPDIITTNSYRFHNPLQKQQQLQPSPLSLPPNIQEYSINPCHETYSHNSNNNFLNLKKSKINSQSNILLGHQIQPIITTTTTTKTSTTEILTTTSMESTDKSIAVTTNNLNVDTILSNALSPVSSSTTTTTATVHDMINDNEFINSEFYIDESLPSSLNDDDDDNDEINRFINTALIKNSKQNYQNDDDLSYIPMLNKDLTANDDMKSITATSFPNQNSVEMVIVLLQENLGSTRLEVEQLKCILKNMSKISSETIALLKNDLKTIQQNALQEKQQLQNIITKITTACSEYENEYKKREENLIKNLQIEHLNEIDTIKNDFKLQINEKQILFDNQTAQLASQQEIINNLEYERDSLRNQIIDLNKQIQLLQDNVNAANIEKERAVNECKERLIHEHKTEIESLRCRFKLMTSMDRSPSDTSLEKIEKPDMIELSYHESILLQAREEMKNEKELAIKEAIELERSKWASGEQQQQQQISNSEKSVTTVNNVELFKKIIEEKDKQIDAMRERDVIISNENSQLKMKIESLTNEDESDKLWLKERLDYLNRDKIRLEQELNTEKSKRIEMESSIATLKSSTIARDVINSPEIGSGARSKMSTSTSSQCVKQGVTIDSCTKGDIVVVVWNIKHGQFTVVQDSSQLYFVHGDSLSALNLKLPGPEDSDIPPQLHCIAKVVDKEYCQARKDENRYKVTRGTKFYRIKLQPVTKFDLGRSHHKRERYESLSSSSSVSRSTSTQHLIDSFAQTENLLVSSSLPQHRDTVDSTTTIVTMSAPSTTSTIPHLFKERTMSVCSATEEDDEPISLLGDRCRYSSLSEEDEKVIVATSEAGFLDMEFSTITTTVTSVMSSSTSNITLTTSATSTNNNNCHNNNNTNNTQQQDKEQQITVQSLAATMTSSATRTTTESSSEKDTQDDSDEYRSLEAKDESDFPTTV